MPAGERTRNGSAAPALERLEPARVTAVAYVRVVDESKSIVELQDVLSAIPQTNAQPF
jgi:hypothetical protein